MCGICFVCSLASDRHLYDEAESPHSCRQIPQSLLKDSMTKDSLLQHRGPDASSSCRVMLPGNLNGFMQGCVLHLRGNLTQQPITNSRGNALLWNGEIFGGIDVKEEENDTQILFNMLDSCCDQGSILQVFQKIDGPWAFMFWQADAKTLWFGRDMFGRRSLLWHLPESPEDHFVLSSVALDEKEVYKEIPSVGIFHMDFSQLEKQGDGMYTSLFTLPPICLHPWLECRWPGTNLPVQKIPSEDLTGHVYPNSKNCKAHFVISDSGINRWIPTMCSSVSNPYGEQLQGGVTEREELFSDSLQSVSTGSNSVPVCETMQANEHKDKDSHAAMDTDSDKILAKIWGERKDLHLLVQKCIKALQETVDTRVTKMVRRKKLNKTKTINELSQESTARIAVLFSGGLDSTLLAALADRCLPEDEPIDLLNVAFEQPTPPVQKHKGKEKKSRKHNRKASHQDMSGKKLHERDHAVEGLSQSDEVTETVSVLGREACSGDSNLPQFYPERTSATSAADITVSGSSATTTVFNPGVSNASVVNGSCVRDSKSPNVSGSDISMSPNQIVSKSSESVVGHLENHSLSSSTKQETYFSVSHLNQKPTMCFPVSTRSAGISATAFDLPKVSHTADVKSPDGNFSEIDDSSNISSTSTPLFDPFNVPDRQTGRIALSELNPRRKWNFVEINVTQAELQSVRKSHISQLIYPLRTVLDDSIGCAVWFAARGLGFVDSATAGKIQQEKQAFQSRAQVLLCGMAADELFAGYSRHRVTFNKEGWAGLEKELQEELWRISARNLGRDDRIITDHGKEARFPFLDEKFIQLVSEIPLQKRVDLSYPRGIGEKLLLRLCAYNLGLIRTACQAKRAIQFGSKIAKLDNKKEKGSDVCDRLLL